MSFFAYIFKYFNFSFSLKIEIYHLNILKIFLNNNFLIFKIFDKSITCLRQQSKLFDNQIKSLAKYYSVHTEVLLPNCCCCCCQVASVVSDSVRPRRWQPTRLPCPWDSPGKNTGVGCHFLLQCMKVKSESEVAQSCPTPSNPMDCSPPGSSVHGIFQAIVLEWGAIAISVCLVTFIQSLLISWILKSCSYG